MNLLSLIRQVRNNVGDPSPPKNGSSTLYDDQIYLDKIEFALNKLNMDLRNCDAFSPLPPWSVNSLPQTPSFLLIKLATIEMMQVRGAESAGSKLLDTETAGISYGINRIEVPGLSVSENQVSQESSGPLYWRKAWELLQKEYDGEILRLIGHTSQKASVSSGSMTAKGFYGETYDRRLAKKLPATTVSAYYLSGTITVSWEPLYSDKFAEYIVYHTNPAGTKVVLTRIFDNHVESFSQALALSAGDNKFSVSIVSVDSLETESSFSTVTV